MSVAAELAKTELFQDLSPTALDAIAALAEERTYEDSEKLYELGDVAEDLYFIHEGSVRFSLGVANRPDAGGAIVNPPQIIGWAALLQSEPRRVATAVCLEDTVVYVISGQKLLRLFEDDSAAGYLVMRRMATMVTRDFLSVMSI